MIERPDLRSCSFSAARIVVQVLVRFITLDAVVASLDAIAGLLQHIRVYLLALDVLQIALVNRLIADPRLRSLLLLLDQFDHLRLLSFLSDHLPTDSDLFLDVLIYIVMLQLVTVIDGLAATVLLIVHEILLRLPQVAPLEADSALRCLD